MKGDALASGQKSAQFFTGGNKGDEVELKNVAAPEEGEELFKVSDKRTMFLSDLTDVKPVETPKKFPVDTYALLQPILDRLLIMCVNEDNDLEILEDGSARNKKTGMFIPAKFRQHTRAGVVLAAGRFVILGGTQIPMEQVVLPGDRVRYGDYNSELFPIQEDKVRELCDAIQVNYEPNEDGIRIVRVQDVRGVEKRLVSGNSQQISSVVVPPYIPPYGGVTNNG